MGFAANQSVGAFCSVDTGSGRAIRRLHGNCMIWRPFPSPSRTPSKGRRIGKPSHEAIYIQVPLWLCVCGLPDWALKQPEETSDLLAEHGITVTQRGSVVADLDPLGESIALSKGNNWALMSRKGSKVSGQTSREVGLVPCPVCSKQVSTAIAWHSMGLIFSHRAQRD